MSDIEDMIADTMPWANKILCRYKDGHPTKRFLRDGEDRVLLAEITRLREDLAISLSYRDELVSANEGLGIALSEAEQREKDARREGWAFAEGDLVRKKSGSWWEGRVVGTYSTEQTPRGYAVQLDKPNGPVQIYPESALVALQSEVN